jgi:hypothetical protein
MATASPVHRAEFINGLRDLASFLAAHLGFPVPGHGATILVFPDGATDADQRAGVDAIAAILGVTTADENGHYTAERAFGPVGYRAVAITAAARERHAADSSYRGCVTPDTIATEPDPGAPAMTGHTPAPNPAAELLLEEYDEIAANPLDASAPMSGQYRARPIFTVKDMTECGQPMRVAASDYDDSGGQFL